MNLSQINAWILAGSTLVNALRVPIAQVREMMRSHGLTIEEQDAILDGIVADATARLEMARAASQPGQVSG